ncbi:MAG: hypothetical protein GX811_00130, partial [Lentisphaerae bacterium]|nr:hypothetical protein [Lentisphaerota bacterium]
ALTQAGGVDWFGNWHSSIWYMVSPPVGTTNVTIDKSSEVKISAMNFSGVDPSTPYRTNYKANGNAPSSVSISASVVAGDLMIDSLLLTNQITWTPSAGQTQINRYSTTSLPCIHGNSYKIASLTGTVGMGWSGAKIQNEMTYITSVFIPAPDKKHQIIIV